MSRHHLSITLDTPAETARRAGELAQGLAAGDVILLDGPVGAGKTHFARALIRVLLRTPEDVPSPTFTLVQTYETTRGDVWHADLYRITSTQEIEELGLVEAFENAICLVEWPDRLGPLAPPDAVWLTLAAGKAEDARRLDVVWQDAKWEAKLAAWRT